MNPNIERLKLIFIGLFVVLAASAIFWQVRYVVPQRACERERHGWWDPETRVCAQPVLISNITRRPITDKAAEAAARAAIGQPAPPAK